MSMDWNYVVNSDKRHFKFCEKDSATFAKRRSRNSVGKYVDKTSLLLGFAKGLDRIRTTWSSIYDFFDPLEIPGAFTELRKVRFEPYVRTRESD